MTDWTVTETTDDFVFTKLGVLQENKFTVMGVTNSLLNGKHLITGTADLYFNKGT